MTIDSNKPANADEAGVREVYRELPQPRPSAELDQAILLAARQALQNDKVVQLPPRLWHKRLLLPLSIAATVVLSFGVVLRMQRSADTQAWRAAGQSDHVAAELAASAPLPASPTPPMSHEPPAPDQPLASATAGAGRQRASVLPATAVQQPVEQAAAPLPAKSAASRAGMSLDVAPPSAGSAAPLPALRQAVPAAVPVPVPAPAAELRDAERSGGRSSPPAAALKSRAMAAGETAPVDPAVVTVRRLLAEGDREAARQALVVYLKSHPDWLVPDDLRRLLDEPAQVAPSPAARLPAAH